MYKKYLGIMQLSGGITVLDLGANSGGFPLVLELAGIAIKKIVCVEMNRNTATRLNFNVTRNLDCDFKMLNVAVCGQRRDFELFLDRGGTSDSLYQDSGTARTAGRKYMIRGITLDDIEREEFNDPGVVDLCKMDVEGAEYEILSSPTHSLLKRVRYLIIEIHNRPGHSKNDLLRKLDELGFTEIEVSGVYNEQDVHLFKNANL
jgi:FkbM family methyltransferase